MNSNTSCKCGVSDDVTKIQTISDNPYSHTNKNYQKIEAYTLFEGWKLYEAELSWTEWFMSYFNPDVGEEKNFVKYIFNLETGEVFSRCHLIDYELVKVGQYGQETKHPYIFMEDSSYIRVLPKYNSVIQNSPYAKKCQQKYIDNVKDDV
jgi:hypothetical protein